MPFSAGVFSRLYNWVTDAGNGIPMTPSRFDSDANDMASGLSNCVTRNGQSPATANLPMGGFKLTGVAAGVNPGDAVNFSQLSSSGIFYIPSGVGSVPRSISSKLGEEISITDRGMSISNSAAVNTTAWQAMLPDIQSGTFSAIYIPPGIFQFNQIGDIPKNITIYGHGFNSQLQFTVLPIAAGSFLNSGGSPGQQYSVASAGTTDWGACGAVLVNATQFSQSLTSGKQYVIKTVGSTNWIALGAAANAAGTIFMATNAAGSGTGVAWERSFTATSAGSGTGNAQPDAMRFIGSVMGAGLMNLTITTTNGAASAVAIEGGAGTNGNGGSQRDFVISRVNFGGSVCAYAVDHRNDYGIVIENCVMNGITGSAVRLRDNGAIPNYSYVSTLRNIDFTATSGICVEAENGGSQGPITFYNCIMENNTSGVLCNTSATGGGFSWNLSFYGGYLENMTGLLVSINRNGAASFIASDVLFMSTYLQGTIDMGDSGQGLAIGCRSQGAANAPLCTVLGSANSTFTQINSNGFTQSGTFAWLTQGVLTAWAPTIGNVTTSGVSGFVSISGRTVTAQLRFVMTAAPTGNITVTLPIPLLAASPINGFYGVNPQIGTVFALNGSTYFTGSVLWNTAASLALFVGNNTAGFWSSAVPVAWSAGAAVNVTLVYQI